ncbi:hypothetical protein AB0B45_11675 [Nonomuraea sp. NPDC049152]|uniref:hypothetical protein n=1 Tax=Nonomuraea sp. NPDC049152 TaxID=3154350 RepID=UPI0033F1472C
MAALVVLTGCGTGTTAQQSASPTPKRDSRHKIQALKANCMKGKGFRYVAFVPVATELNREQDNAAAGDYAAMRADRSKYGFNVSYMLVNRRETRGRESGEPPANPNDAFKQDLSLTQQKAYDNASEACEALAINQVTGKNVKSQRDWLDQASDLIDQRTKRVLDGDSNLAGLASAMADCMTGKGYQVSSTNPTAMVAWGQKKFAKEMHEIARREGGDDVPAFDPVKGPWYMPTDLSASEARRYLDREIKVALDDLECGKAFYAAYLPSEEQIVLQVQAEFGQGSE